MTEKGNYTELDAAHIIRQILQGVQYLHSHGESWFTESPGFLTGAGHTSSSHSTLAAAAKQHAAPSNTVVAHVQRPPSRVAQPAWCGTVCSVLPSVVPARWLGRVVGGCSAPSFLV